MIRNKIIGLLLIVLTPVVLMAQDETAPLIEKMQRAQGTEKIDLLNDISATCRKTDRHKAMDFARQAFTLSSEAKYLPGKALAKKNEGICWFFIGNNDSAIVCYKQALDIFIKTGDKKGISACYNNLGLISQETGRYDEALKFFEHSVEMDTKLHDQIGVALTKENMVSICIYQGDAKAALKLANECIAIYTAQAYKPGLMAGFCNRGSGFAYLKQYDNAIRDFNKALNMAIELNDRYYEIMVSSNLGQTYWFMKKPEIAMKYLENALEMNDEADDAYTIDKTLSTMAEIFTSRKEYVKSIEILQKLLKRNEDTKNIRQAAEVMTAIGRNLIELNEMDKAVGYLAKSLQITVKINARYEMLENYRNLAYANAILHNFEIADSMQDLFAQTYSRLYNSDSIAEQRKGKIRAYESYSSSTSTSSHWIIAFLLMALVMILSVIAYRGNKKGI